MADMLSPRWSGRWLVGTRRPGYPDQPSNMEILVRWNGSSARGSRRVPAARVPRFTALHSGAYPEPGTGDWHATG